MDQELQTILQECDTLKARLSAMRPLPVEAMKKIEDALAIEYTYESNRIEGEHAHASGNGTGGERGSDHFGKVHA